MFALIHSGNVQGLRRVKGREGTWLPVVEDPKTYSPTEDQIVAGYTVQKIQVIRHWRLKSPVATLDDINRVLEHADKIADSVVALAEDASPEIRQAVVTNLSVETVVTP